MRRPQGEGRPTHASRRPRRLLRWGLAVLTGSSIVLGWASIAGADDPETSTQVECLKSPESVLPGEDGDSVAKRAGAYIREQLNPVERTAQAARRVGWILDYVGLDIPGPLKDKADLHEKVTVWGPSWYLEEAKKEADEHDNCSLARTTPTGSCALWRDRTGPRQHDTIAESQATADAPGRNGATGLLPDKCWGPYPADAYDVHYDDGGVFSWDRKVWGSMTGTIHAIGKGAMQVALGLLGFAFSTFQVLDYKNIALTAADGYQTNMVGPFGLVDLAYFVLFAYAAITALRGKFGVAGGEIALTLIVASLASVLMANRQGYLEGATKTMDDATTSILAAGNGQDPSTPTSTKEALLPVQMTLFEEFIDRPFDYINFGGRVTDAECVERRNRILYANVPSDGGWGIRYMEAGGEACVKHAEAMAIPSAQRMLMALLTTIVAAGVAIVVGGAALTMLIAKILLLVLFALLPFAAVAAILPGLGRRLAWGWASTLLQALIAGAGMAFVVSVFLLGFQGVVDNSDALGPFERWVVMLVIVAVVFILRSRIVDSSKKFAGFVGDSLTRLSPASAHWQGGGTGGEDLLKAERGTGRYVGQHAPLVAAASGGVAAGIAASSYNRWRMGQIGLRNLRKMQRYKEAAGHEKAPARRWTRGGRALEAATHFVTRGRMGRRYGQAGAMANLPRLDPKGAATSGPRPAPPLIVPGRGGPGGGPRGPSMPPGGASPRLIVPSSRPTQPKKVLPGGNFNGSFSNLPRGAPPQTPKGNGAIVRKAAAAVGRAGQARTYQRRFWGRTPNPPISRRKR